MRKKSRVIDQKMDEKIAANDLTNYSSPEMILQQFNGTGYLRCSDEPPLDCNFSIIRLLNGRLQVKITSEKWSSLFDRCKTFEIEGTDEEGCQILVTNIHFTRRYLSFSETWLGYAQSVTRRAKRDSYPNIITIRCDLTNFRLFSTDFPITFKIEDYDVEIGRLSWSKREEIIKEHSYAYHHATIFTYLRIKDISVEEQDRAIECLHKVITLLSIACRGHVFPAGQHLSGEVDSWLLESQFTEPPFTDRCWPRALIPSEAMGDFLAATYPHLMTKYRSLVLADVIDHYLQALTLRSAWPMSLGIFTAMETLKAAFSRHTKAENEKFEFWIVPSGTFEAKTELFDEVISTFCHHFPRFCTLEESERESLKSQLKGLNRRSYKTQLKRIFSQLGVSYQNDELQSFVDIRNRIIHQGTPTEGEISTADFEDRTSKAWKQIGTAINLFEKTLLAVLGYSGPSELFKTSKV